MGHRILIVDDSGFSRATIRKILEEAGLEVVGEAKNGVEALDQIELLQPDLITLDNILPDMTGLEILRVLREQEIVANVIMISAVGQRSAIEEGLHLGAKKYMIKPFTADKLLEEVREVLEIT
ncbi:response regulator [Marinoscillum furvescens]|uniref:Two-component system chemotaxis response regulator CheY n=1 Tax=Marinoscillum furvescens DSM 4134 TaxID=1122208 RepID=A0A3D9L4Q8_MARFU|nr:response regulator [Marinoscillum furvescens]REE01005.1 two-component system chemotaxis response regulator CheY [Marinoscillum furvescens DSM 4134]